MKFVLKTIHRKKYSKKNRSHLYFAKIFIGQIFYKVKKWKLNRANKKMKLTSRLKI